MAQTGILLESQLPGVMESGLVTNKDAYFNGNLTVYGTTNIAAVSLTDLTATGNTVLGNAATDTLAITGLVTQTLTSSSTSLVEPFVTTTTLSGAGVTGGRIKNSLTISGAAGSFTNAIKGDVTYGVSGKTTGLGSSVVAEMTLSAGTSDGTYSPLEVELNLGTGASTGTATSLIYGSVNGADAATFSTNGFIMNLAGLTAGASNVFQTGLTGATVVGNMTAALRIKVGSTSYFIPLATATT